MRYRYQMPAPLKEQALHLEEFANSGAQCHARLRNGTVQPGLLISNATAIIAMRGQDELPFAVEDIAELYQTEEDRSPEQRGSWRFFDEWSV